MSSVVLDTLRGSREVIFVGERPITRLTEEGRGRYVIHLPTAQNELWEALWGKGVKVKVCLEVVRGRRASQAGVKLREKAGGGCGQD